MEISGFQDLKQSYLTPQFVAQQGIQLPNPQSAHHAMNFGVSGGLDHRSRTLKSSSGAMNLEAPRDLDYCSPSTPQSGIQRPAGPQLG